MHPGPGLGIDRPEGMSREPLSIDGPKCVLPTGKTLWHSQKRDGRGASGLTAFGTPPYQIAVPGGFDVPMPSDAGLVVMHALERSRDQHQLNLEGSHVLDIGAGSGILTLPCLKAGCEKATAIDINPGSPDVVRHNVRINFPNNSDDRLITQVAEFGTWEPNRRYHLALVNPPQLPDKHTYSHPDGAQLALHGGPLGRDLLDKTIDRIDDLLTDDGMLLIGHSSFSNVPLTVDRMSRKGYDVRVLGSYEKDSWLAPASDHWPELQDHLEQLRREGHSVFDPETRRGWTHVLIFSKRPASGAFQSMGWPPEATNW